MNIARLDYGTYEEIVAYPERELELDPLEVSDHLLMTTTASASTGSRSPLSNGMDTTNGMTNARTARRTAIFGKNIQN